MLRNAREEARELITAPCTEFDELGGNERSCVVQAFRVAADAREEVENPKTSSASRLALPIPGSQTGRGHQAVDACSGNSFAYCVSVGQRSSPDCGRPPSQTGN